MFPKHAQTQINKTSFQIQKIFQSWNHENTSFFIRFHNRLFEEVFVH